MHAPHHPRPRSLGPPRAASAGRQRGKEHGGRCLRAARPSAGHPGGRPAASLAERRPRSAPRGPGGQGSPARPARRALVTVTLDANVLVYASNEVDPAHGAARALVEELAAGPGLVYLFWPTIMGYLRIVTHSAILPRPLGFGEASGNVTALLER